MYHNYEFFKKPIKVVAHRGDSMFYPENSMLAFKSAVELGVDVIETDVHVTAEGVVFVWHDDDTRVIDGSEQFVSHKSWHELKDLDLGYVYIDKDGKRPFASKGIGFLTFQEVLRAFPNTRFNVDLKDRRNDLVDNMYKILEKENAFDRVTIASFHDSNLRRMRAHSKKVVTSYGKGEVLRRIILLKMGLFRVLSKSMAKHPVMQVPVSSGLFQVVTKTLIKILHKRGIKIQVWTINERDQMEALLKMGVDGIMTDNPRLLLDVIKNYSR